MGEWYSLSAGIYGTVLVEGTSSIEKRKNEQYVRLWQKC